MSAGELEEEEVAKPQAPKNDQIPTSNFKSPDRVYIADLVIGCFPLKKII